MSEVNRRRVVGGAVALGTLPVLAACGNDDGGATASDPGATSAPPAGGSAGGSGGGEALVATSEVPVYSQVRSSWAFFTPFQAMVLPRPPTMIIASTKIENENANWPALTVVK